MDAIKSRYASITLALLIVTALYYWVTAETIIYSVPSPDHEKIAQLSIKPSLPFFMPDAYFTVRIISGEILERYEIATASDAMEDILRMVERIDWQNGQPILYGDGNHYVGPMRYGPKSPNQPHE